GVPGICRLLRVVPPLPTDVPPESFHARVRARPRPRDNNARTRGAPPASTPAASLVRPRPPSSAPASSLPVRPPAPRAGRPAFGSLPSSSLAGRFPPGPPSLAQAVPCWQGRLVNECLLNRWAAKLSWWIRATG